MLGDIFSFTAGREVPPCFSGECRLAMTVVVAPPLRRPARVITGSRRRPRLRELPPGEAAAEPSIPARKN